MEDWRKFDPAELSADDAGNKVIALALGWHLVELDEPLVEWVTPPGVELASTHRLVDADGADLMLAPAKPDWLWHHAPFEDWTGSMDAALGLINHLPYPEYRWHIFRHASNGLYYANILRYEKRLPEASGLTPALTICRVWLGFQQLFLEVE